MVEKCRRTRRFESCDPRLHFIEEPMTRMSEPPMSSARTVEQLAMARPLHSGGVLRAAYLASWALGFAMFAGCVIPPSLSVDTTDAGANSAPAIVSVRADLVEFPQYSTLVFEKGNGAGQLNVTLHDTDLDDVLTVKIFVNYNHPDPTPARSECKAAGHSVERTCSASMETVCTSADIGANPLPIMQVFVFDRTIEPDISPPFQGMAADGLKTSQTFFLRCQDPSL
jgi:hypothetical protein